MSLLRPLYQNKYLPSSPHIYPLRYQENYCTKQDKEVFHGHFFFIVRSVKYVLADQTPGWPPPPPGQLLSPSSLFSYFVCLFVLFFFPLHLILPALECKQTNKQTLLKKREEKKSKGIVIGSFLTCTSPFMSYKKRCKWIGTTLSSTTSVAMKGQPYLLESHKPDVGRPNSFGLSALITRKKTSFKLKCMRLEWAGYVGFTVLWQGDYRLTMSGGTSFNTSNKTFSGAC